MLESEPWSVRQGMNAQSTEKHSKTACNCTELHSRLRAMPGCGLPMMPFGQLLHPKDESLELHRRVPGTISATRGSQRSVQD